MCVCTFYDLRCFQAQSVSRFWLTITRALVFELPEVGELTPNCFITSPNVKFCTGRLAIGLCIQLRLHHNNFGQTLTVEKLNPQLIFRNSNIALGIVCSLHQTDHIPLQFDCVVNLLDNQKCNKQYSILSVSGCYCWLPITCM